MSEPTEDDYEAPECIGYLLHEPGEEEGLICWRWEWDKGMDSIQRADILSDLLGLLATEYNRAVEAIGKDGD